MDAPHGGAERKVNPMAKAKGLGRGLGALMGDVALQSQESGSVLLPISQVEPGLNQPRKYFDEESLTDLAQSIREHGIIQPLTVRRLSSGYYQIIAGERRWRAAKQAGLSEVPAIVIEADDKKVMELGLIENLQRENLNPMEEAEGYLMLLTDYGMTQEEVAHRMGKSRPAVANALRLTALPPAVRELLIQGQLSAGHAAKHFHVAQESAQEKPKREDPHRMYLADVEKTLSSQFGRKVSITTGRKKGTLELEFYNMDDLNTLLDLLGSIPSTAHTKEESQ